MDTMYQQAGVPLTHRHIATYPNAVDSAEERHEHCLLAIVVGLGAV